MRAARLLGVLDDIVGHFTEGHCNSPSQLFAESGLFE